MYAIVPRDVPGAQSAGAVGVVMANNEPGPLTGATLGPDDRPGIPVLGIAGDDAALLLQLRGIDPPDPDLAAVERKGIAVVDAGNTSQQVSKHWSGAQQNSGENSRGEFQH